MELDKTFFVVVVMLHLFGWVYNELVAWMERNGYDEGYTALLVVGGVLATLAGLAILRGLESAVYVALLFVASGTPMIIGSMARHARRRAKDEQKARDDVRKSLGVQDGNA
jgi:hypothetical protein